MKRNKLYLIEGHETYHTLDEIISYMKENDMKEAKVAVGKIERGTEFFFCKAKEEIGLSGCCGKECDSYKPRNGKSGICRHYGYVYKSAKDYVLNVNGELKESEAKK